MNSHASLRKNINRVTIRGEVAEAVDITDTNAGVAVANLKIKVPRERQSGYHLFNIVAYGKPAKEIDYAEYLAGDIIDITGFLQQNRWRRRDTGDWDSRVVIVAKKSKKVEADDNAEVDGED